MLLFSTRYPLDQSVDLHEFQKANFLSQEFIKYKIGSEREEREKNDTPNKQEFSLPCERVHRTNTVCPDRQAAKNNNDGARLEQK